MNLYAPEARPAILTVEGIKVHYPITAGLLKRKVGEVRAVDGVSFTVQEGECLGIVGESGCGKTTLGRAIVRIHRPTEGKVLYRTAAGDKVDLASLPERELDRYRGDMRMVFQDPYSSLNPRMTVEQIVGEPLRLIGGMKGQELRDRVVALLKEVGLRSLHMSRYPHAFSGGERQRIGIARALTLNPRVLVADEAVSALDVSVQAQTINLLRNLQRKHALTYLFIAHDLSVVEYISDRVAVMYAGRIVELAVTEALFGRPRHPYTEALLSAVPLPDPRLRNSGKRIRLSGEPVDPSNVPSGCPFHTRCAYADGDRCRKEVPKLRALEAGQLAACHHAERLSLKGAERPS